MRPGQRTGSAFSWNTWPLKAPQAHRLRHRPGDRPVRRLLQRLHQQGADLLPRQGAGRAPAAVVDLLGDMVLHPLCGTQDLERERQVILEEIYSQDDNPKTRCRSPSAGNSGGTTPGPAHPGERRNTSPPVSREDSWLPPGHLPAGRNGGGRGGPGRAPAPGGPGGGHFQGFANGLPVRAAAPGGLSSRHLPHSRDLEQVTSVSAPGASPPEPPSVLPPTMLQLILGGNMIPPLSGDPGGLGLAYSIYSFLSFFSDTGLFGISARGERQKPGSLAGCGVPGINPN